MMVYDSDSEQADSNPTDRSNWPRLAYRRFGLPQGGDLNLDHPAGFADCPLHRLALEIQQKMSGSADKAEKRHVDFPAIRF